MTAIATPADVTVEQETTGNYAYFSVHGVPMTDDGQEAAEVAAAEVAEQFCRQHVETYPNGASHFPQYGPRQDYYWSVVWEIH